MLSCRGAGDLGTRHGVPLLRAYREYTKRVVVVIVMDIIWEISGLVIHYLLDLLMLVRAKNVVGLLMHICTHGTLEIDDAQRDIPPAILKKDAGKYILP